MVDYLLQATLSNFLVAAILALIAWIVQMRVRSASLSNLLWMLVLIKLVTPPLLSVPLFGVPSLSEPTPVAAITDEATPIASFALREATSDGISSGVAADFEPSQPSISATTKSNQIATFALVIWMATSLLLLLISVVRIWRFHRLLLPNMHLSRKFTKSLSEPVAQKFGLRKAPPVMTCSANIAPFVWWSRFRPIVVVSKQAAENLSQSDLRLIIAHEIAHIKRRDHWLRWLEWAAMLGFWWNPIMWLARHQLRTFEEIACDDLVLEHASPETHQYANSLLNMAEVLVSPAVRPPVVASAINSGGNLEKRLKMIIADNSNRIPNALRIMVIAAAACLFPLGFVYAQDFKAVERRLGGAVEAGEISLDQARVMMDALRGSKARGAEDPRGMEMEMEKKRRYERIAVEIEEAVKAGIISKQDAKKKLVALEKEMFRERRARNENVKVRAQTEMEAKERQLVAVMREIEAAVKAGQLSKRDAEKKLAAIKEKMFGNRREKRDNERYRLDQELAAKEREFMQVAREIEKAMKAGTISEEDAKRKLEAIKREMGGMRRGISANERIRIENEIDARERRFVALAREMEAAVKAGTISKEEAEKKLAEVKEKMFGERKELKRRRQVESEELKEKKARYVEIATKFEMAVKDGKMSAEDAKAKLGELRKKMFGDKK